MIRATRGARSAAVWLSRVASIATVLLAVPGTALAQEPEGYRYAHSGPGVSLDIINSTGGVPVGTPVATWDSSKSVSLDLSSGIDGSRFRRRCPMPDDHAIRICAYPYRFPGADGRTTLLTEGDPGSGHAISAVVKLDTSGGCCSKGQMRALVCHEVGHALGLDHRSVKSRSCMETPISSATPDDRDFANLDRIYGVPG